MNLSSWRSDRGLLALYGPEGNRKPSHPREAPSPAAPRTHATAPYKEHHPILKQENKLYSKKFLSKLLEKEKRKGKIRCSFHKRRWILSKTLPLPPIPAPKPRPASYPPPSGALPPEGWLSLPLPPFTLAGASVDVISRFKTQISHPRLISKQIDLNSRDPSPHHPKTRNKQRSQTKNPEFLQNSTLRSLPALKTPFKSPTHNPNSIKTRNPLTSNNQINTLPTQPTPQTRSNHHHPKIKQKNNQNPKKKNLKKQKPHWNPPKPNPQTLQTPSTQQNLNLHQIKPRKPPIQTQISKQRSPRNRSKPFLHASLFSPLPSASSKKSKKQGTRTRRVFFFFFSFAPADKGNVILILA